MNNDSTLRLELKNVQFQELHYSHCTRGGLDKGKKFMYTYTFVLFSQMLNIFKQK